MTQRTQTPRDLPCFDHDASFRKVSPRRVAGVIMLAAGGLSGAWMLDAPPVARPTVVATSVPDLSGPAMVMARNTPPQGYGALLAPGLAAGLAPMPLGQNAPLGAAFALVPDPPTTVAQVDDQAGAAEIQTKTEAAAVTVADADAALPLPVPDLPPVVQSVPLPLPRPPEFQAPVSRIPFRAPVRQMARRAMSLVVASAPPDNRSFFEKLFGASQPAGPALAYAAPETESLFGRTASLAPGPRPSPDRQTAIYDIAAHTVYMPDGTRLEAHSGLGDRLDDPRFVHERMRGPTPPHVYDLTQREALFHGVRALRLNPVGGGGVFGRTGLLAHTYMLGPNGDSNGCISFRNYNAFLQAFLNGEIKRLTVVTHS